MNVSRIAAAGSAVTPAPRVAPSTSQVQAKNKQVEPAAIVSLRSTYQRGWDAARGGHSVQEAGNLDAVPNHALQRVRSVLQRGWDSMRGGHKVQQATYEPTVSNTELTGHIRQINDNVRGFAGGSKVQAESRTPTFADRDYGPRARALAESVSAKLKQARPQLGKIQTAQLDTSVARHLLG